MIWILENSEVVGRPFSRKQAIYLAQGITAKFLLALPDEMRRGKIGGVEKEGEKRKIRIEWSFSLYLLGLNNEKNRKKYTQTKWKK